MGILRTLLAIGVLICHSSPVFGISSMGGEDAIKAFFIISGFYMSLILNEKYTGIENSYKLFITNRLLRLYPLYFSILIFTFLFQLFTTIVFDNHKVAGVISFIDHFNELPWYSTLILILPIFQL
jgi:peptidoglycan/LPS O-acetylase OafA/YrhL